MVKRTLAAASVAVIAGCFSLGATSLPTSAATLFGPQTFQTASDNNIQLADTVVKKKKVVKKNKKGKVVTRTTVTRYDSNRHGRRFRHREGPYVYYHDGYYYQQPWWTLAVPGVNLCIGC